MLCRQFRCFEFEAPDRPDGYCERHGAQRDETAAKIARAGRGNRR